MNISEQTDGRERYTIVTTQNFTQKWLPVSGTSGK